MSAKPRDPATRFWEKVEKIAGVDCWLWTASTLPNGYGKFGINSRLSMGSHRFAYELTNGPIPGGLCVCHHCDVKLCVRPSHLYLGTMKDNMRDASKRHRLWEQNVRACPYGHEYTADNTCVITRSSGKKQRQCRACFRRRNAIRAERKAQACATGSLR